MFGMGLGLGLGRGLGGADWGTGEQTTKKEKFENKNDEANGLMLSLFR